MQPQLLLHPQRPLPRAPASLASGRHRGASRAGPLGKVLHEGQGPGLGRNGVRALDAEEGLASSIGSPLDVYHKLQSLIPPTDDLVVPAWHAEGDSVRLRSRQDLDAMPWFPWGQLYGMECYDPASDRAKDMAARVF